MKIKPIAIIWLIFTLLFGFLSYYHYLQSKTKYPSFVVGKSPSVSGVYFGKPLENFAKQFNDYLEEQNKSNYRVNIATMLGYFIATLAALVSFLISFDTINKGVNDIYYLKYKDGLEGFIKRILHLAKKAKLPSGNKD